MKYQANRSYKSNDVVMTPEPLARAIINHFNPTGRVLEPCRGMGAFYNNFPADKDWCEISEGKDFLTYTGNVEWIITNPPWSKIREFMRKSMEISNNIVFLFTINHVWTKARMRDIKEFKFGIREIIMIDTPTTFPPMGFQLGVVHYQKEYSGPIILTDWRERTYE